MSAANQKIDAETVLVLGVGNVLMGDEGVGVQAVRELEKMPLPPNVECLDGGTGGFHLLGPLQDADRVLLIDACIDGQPSGTVRRLQPRFSSDYPRTLTAHDIGLKDLLDAAYLTDAPLNVTLFAISIDPLQGIGTELRTTLATQLPEIVRLIAAELPYSSSRK